MYFIVLAFIAIAASLVWYLLRHDHGRQLPVESLWIAFGFGIVAVVLAVLGEGFLVPPGFATHPAAFTHLEQLGWFMVIGFCEEAVKFIPLALFLYRKPYFREHVDGCIYFAICGLTFGLVENILYTGSFGASVGITRLLLTPFFHAATTSILGYYLITTKLTPKGGYLFMLAAVAVPVLHGMYDFGLGSGIGTLQVMSLMITVLLTLGLFLYFMQANLLDRLLMRVTVPAVSTNFCSGCGRANALHGNYCEYCGRKL